MGSDRRRLSLLAACLLAVAAIGLGSTTALASGSGCTNGSSSGNVSTCISITGQGLEIDVATASAHVFTSGRYLLVKVIDPSGLTKAASNNGYFEFVKPGQTIYASWAPYSTEPPGQYCAYTWRLNSDGGNTNIGAWCIDVHS